MLSETVLSRHASHPILAIKDHTRATVGIEQRWRRRKFLELTPGLLATGAIAGTGQDRGAGCLELYPAALARCG